MDGSTISPTATPARKGVLAAVALMLTLAALALWPAPPAAAWSSSYCGHGSKIRVAGAARLHEYFVSHRTYMNPVLFVQVHLHTYRHETWVYTGPFGRGMRKAESHMYTRAC